MLERNIKSNVAKLGYSHMFCGNISPIYLKNYSKTLDLGQ